MSGGRLVVLDLQGRDVKYYPLKEGLATLGSDPICDIRFLLPTVSAHHATVSVHTNQCVVHAVGTDPTLVNGTVVSVAALRHGDEISVGGRRLRWEYNDPSQKRVTPVVTMPALARRSIDKRNIRRRVTTGSGKSALVPPLRASTGALDWHSGNASSSSSGKQVAIVQPWGKDTNNENDSITMPATRRKRRRSLQLDDSADLDEPPKKRWATLGGGDSATKASLWCESRRAPRRTPFKIHDPPGVDHTKQAALMLMTGHTPKPKETPRATPRRKRVSGTKRRTRQGQSTPRQRRAREGPHSISLLEIGPVSRRSEGSSRTERSNSLTSLILGSPKKSAMKDPTARKSTRKTESIKFDLSNLDGHERSSDLIMFDNTEKDDYSESSVTMSPSPKKNSRSSKILEKSLRYSNTINTLSPRHISSQRSTLEATAPTLGRSPKKSLWGSIILKKALEKSREASKSRDSDQSYATAESPRASVRQTETYTEVDLVSLDSDGSRSVYESTESFESPQLIITSQSDRKTRSGKPYLLATSTPNHGKAKGSPRDLESDKETSRNKTRGRCSFSSTGKKPSLSIVSVRSESNQTNVSDKSKKTTRRSASLTTPKNSYWSLSLNSTKATRASKSRSRINDSDLLLLDDDDDASPRSSRRRSGATPRKNISIVAESSSSDGAKDGCVTPENEHSPKDAGTPVLNIQNLLDQSLDWSIPVRNSRKRKTIGHIRSVKRPNVARAKSFTQTRSKKMDSSNDEDGIITPTSDVQLVPESVKNKHSTAKKPQSKRSLIDTLDESDVVKQLFSSPVKRNLSRSMSDFNWRDDEKPVTRHTIALTGRSLNTSGLSVLHDSAHIAPEVFVSPLGTPNVSPNLSGVKRLFARRTRNDLSDVRGVKGLLKTPRARRSIVNDLTRVSGVKNTFARSPKNRLSDVRVKELFVPSPKNDLRRVFGVKSLFQSVETRQMASPNVENIRGLFKRIPRNELVNVSGVTALKRRSPRNDLTDVEGIDQLYEEPAAGDMSGVELLQEQEDADSTFDRLLGKPKLKSYGKSKSMTIFSNAKQKRAAKSLHDSIDAINTNVEEWLQGQLQKSSSKRNSGNARELQKLSTATVEGAAPVLTSRSRSSTFAKDQSTLFDVSKRTSKGELSRSKAEKSRNSKAEASLSKSKRQSNETSQSKSVAPATLQLPIKKRVGVHSTPVKGVHATLNTTALARMSPINAIDVLTKTSMATLNEPKKPAGKNKRSLQKQLPEIVVTANNSPKKVEAKNKTRTPIQSPTTRRKAAEISKRLLQKQLPEIVVTANNSPKKVEAKNKTRTPIQPPTTRRKAAEISKRLLEKQLPEIVVTANNSPKKVEAKNETRTPIQPPTARRKAAEISKRLLEKQLPEIVVTANNSPKKVEAKNETRTPIQPPTTRRKAAETKLSTVIKRRKSITITKKPPVLSPKPVKQVSEKPASPKRARSTRNKVEEKRKTPAKISKRLLQNQLPEIVVTADNSPKTVEAKNKTRTPIQPPTTRRKAAEISKRLLQKQLPEIVVTVNNSPKKVEAKNKTRTPIQPPTTRRKAAEIIKILLDKQLPEIVVTANNSPKKVEAKNKTRTPIQPPTTRIKAAETKLSTVIKRRKSITIAKKPPVLSPKPVKQVSEKPASPKRARSTRNKVEEKRKTPAKISKRLLQNQLPEIVVTAYNSPKTVEAKNKTRTPIQPPTTRRKAAEIIKRLLEKQLPEIVVTTNNSPKKVEAKNKTRTPIQPPTTRIKAAETKLSTVIKRRKSITIAKKPPVLSPKPVKQVSEKPASPKRARSTRNKVEEKRKTPAKSRAKARRISVVVSKPSPRLKPKSATPAKGTNRTGRTKVVEEPPKETQTRQSRKTKATENVSNASKKTKIEVEKSVEKQPAKSSTRKTQIIEEIAKETEVKTARRGRKTQEIKNIEEPSKISPKTINSKVEDISTSKKSPIKSPVKFALNRSRRGQTNVTNVEVSKTNEEPKPRGGRKTETTTEIIEVKKGRKTRAIESVATETAPKRATTAKAEVVTEAKPVRGRKTAATEPKEEPKGRRSEKVAIVEETIEVTQKGRLTKTQSTSEDKNTSKKGGKQKAESPAPKCRDITRNAVKVAPSTGRGKKATNASANKTAPASTTDRKRKSNEPVAKEELRSTRSGRRY